MKFSGKEFRLRWLLLIAAVLFAGLISFTGCASTVVPKPVSSPQASFDGAEQNSGVLALTSLGALVTPHFRDRYNALVVSYGSKYRPVIEPDAGLFRRGGRETGFPQYEDVWEIDKEHLVKFLEMNAWRRMGRAPAQ